MKDFKTITITVLVAVLILALGAPLFAGVGFVLSPSSFELTMPPGEIYTKKIEIAGAAEYYQRYITENGADWVTVTPDKGTVGPDLTEEVELRIDSNGLELGKHHTRIDVVEVLSGEKSQLLSQIDITLNISDQKPELITIPRSLEMQQGQLQQVFLVNPMDQPIDLEIFSIDPWLYVSPDVLRVEPGDVAIFYVRSSSIATTGGVWSSAILINSLEDSSGLQVGATLPVTVNISSGVDFNPSEITAPGPLAITNKLSRPVYIETPNGGDVEIDEDIFRLEPGERKIVNLSWESDKNPNHLDFFIIGGKLNVHRVLINNTTNE